MRILTHFTPLVCLILMLSGVRSTAQSMLDGYMLGKNNGNISLSYTSDWYKEFYNGTKKVPEVPAHKKITQNIFCLFANYGISDRLDAIVNLPYIASKGHGGPDPFSMQTEAKGLQDLSVFLKYQLFNASNEQGQFSGMIAAGLTTPLSDYEPNAILSIGNQATTVQGNAIVQYKFNSGLFATAQGGYQIKSGEVPNASIFQMMVGFAAAKVYVAGFVYSQISDKNAPDINPPAVPFQETRVNYTAIGLNLFIPVTPVLGISAGVSNFVSGRNVGLSTNITGGINIRL